jgi:protein-S-isoprenylcysteine O-methyltransferase Ste14
MPKPAFFLLSSEAKIAFATLLALYWISESLIGLRMRAGHQDRTDDRGSLRLIAIVFPVSWWVGIAIIWVVPQASLGSSAVFGAGLFIMIAGQLLRWWSVATLGRLFTVNVAIREGHQLIDSGPYHYVRHPAYTAILLFHLGAALCLCNVLSLVALTVPTAVTLLNRVRVEEDVLLSGLGDTYRDYMTRTKRLIPGLY